ncbi:MAG TPA: FtsX-like permease family protein [Gemmatimonadaceae bacterium]
MDLPDHRHATDGHSRHRRADRGAAGADVPQALRYVPGIVTETWGADARFDSKYSSLVVRGFSAEEYLDGMKVLNGVFTTPQLDPYALEDVAFVQRPASVLYRQAAPGGVFNAESKRPSATPLHEVEVQTGSYNRAQVGLDFSGPLDGAAHCRYRLTALGRDADTQVEFQKSERLLVAPAFTWAPSDATSFTVLGSYQRDPHAAFYYYYPLQRMLLAAPGEQLSSNFYGGDATHESYGLDQLSGGWMFRHRFNSTWSVEQHTRASNVRNVINMICPIGFVQDSTGASNLGQFDRYVFLNHERLSAITLDNQARATFVPGYQFRSGESHIVTFDVIGDGYFGTVGIPIVDGREFGLTERGALDADKVVVNAAFARHFWSGQQAIGKTVMVHERFPAQVIGVVNDAAYSDIGMAPEPRYYLSMSQIPRYDIEVLVRIADNARVTADMLQSVASKYSNHPERIVFTTLQHRRELRLQPIRLVGTVLTVFAAIALLLSVFALHALLSYLVHNERKETGVRLAFGASPLQVCARTVRVALALLTAGAVLGLTIAYVLIATFPNERITSAPQLLLVAAAAVLIAAGLAGSALPAWRASMTPPSEALRDIQLHYLNRAHVDRIVRHETIALESESRVLL